MKIKRTLAVILCGIMCFALVSGLIGCSANPGDAQPTEVPDPVIVSKYLLTGDPAGKGNDALNICLYSNGKMTFSCIKENTAALSYLCIGTWSEEGDVLTIVTDNGDFTAHFAFDKGKKNLSYIAEGSDSFAGYHVQEGDVFYLALKFAE